jgi:PAS domain S-box-containing protein
MGRNDERRKGAARGRRSGAAADAPGPAGERHYRHFFEDNPLPMWIIDPKSLRFLEVNRAAVALYGFARAEFLSMTTFDLRPPQDLESYRAYLAGRDPHGTTVKRPTRHRRRDGSLIEVETTAYPFLHEGRLARLVLINDVTDRKRAEDELRASEERYRVLFEAVPHPILVRDNVTLRILAVNQAAVDAYGYTREEFARLSTLDLLDPREHERYLADLRRQQIDEVTTAQRRHVTRDGRIIDADVSSRPFVFGGRPARLSLITDVTETRRAERALRESEARLSAIFQGEPECVKVVSAAGDLVEMNPAGLAMLEVASVEEARRIGLAGFVAEKDRPAFLALHARVMSGQEGELEFEATGLKGTRRRLETRAVPLRDASGRVTALLGITRDVTERRRMEDALRESEERFRAAFEQAAVGMAIRDVDPRRPRWLRVNQKLCDILGYSREELLQLTSVDITPPEDRELAVDYNEQLLRGELTSYTREKRYVRKDGRVIWANISLSAVRGADGRPTHVISVIEDITGRREAAAAEERERELLRTVIDNVPHHIHVKDREGRYLLVNAADLRWRGVGDAREVLGRSTMEFYPPDVARRYLALDQEVFRTGRPIVDLEQFLDNGRGERGWFLTSKLPLLDREGRPEAVVTINRDITELRARAEEAQRFNVELERRVAERTRQLEAANRELESFAYSVSHDLRAPLRSVEGFSQALMEDCAERLDETGRDYLRRVRGAARRMSELIDDLLMLSRMTQADMRSETVDLSALAAEIVQELRGQHPRRRVEVAIAPGIAARGDAGLLRVALHNLLANAWKFSSGRDDALVEFGAAEREGRTVHFVRDNGVGFDMRYAERLFGAFQRLHAEHEFPGTGVGLATVRRIVRRHGGEVWAESAPGRGATFFFTLAGEGEGG